MSTWHQDKAGIPPVGEGWVLVSDGVGRMQTRLHLKNEAQARRAIIQHRKISPGLCHLLYHDGRIVG